jgi:hypothetical protein
MWRLGQRFAAPCAVVVSPDAEAKYESPCWCGRGWIAAIRGAQSTSGAWTRNPTVTSTSNLTHNMNCCTKHAKHFENHVASRPRGPSLNGARVEMTKACYFRGPSIANGPIPQASRPHSITSGAPSEKRMFVIQIPFFTRVQLPQGFLRHGLLRIPLTIVTPHPQTQQR